MSLGDAYTLGVRLTGDTTALRASLQEAKSDLASFQQAAAAAMSGTGASAGATAAEQAATRVGQAARRQAQETDQAGRRTQQATRQTASAFDDYMRRATAAQEEVARSSRETSQETERSLGGIGTTLGRITGFAGMALLVRQIGQAGIGFHEFTQNSQIALSNMLGGVEQSREFLADVLEFAKQTPFAFTSLTETAQQLLAMNVNAKDVIPTLRSLGDAAASQGQGIERLQQLAGIVGQINTIGRLGGNEMRRLQEAGVPVLNGLANLAGVTAGEFQKMVSDGLVPAEWALENLRKVIDEGTDGINGQTVAMGGLMAEIKGAGGVTATVDSAKSAFRNMSAELTESLVPTYVGLLRLLTDGMGIVRSTAGAFNDLPAPVRNAALAVGALTIAHRLLNTQARATGVWTAWTTQIHASRAAAQAMGFEVGRLRGTMMAARTAAPMLGSALLGAFGGPVGLAITGVTAAVIAYSGAQAEARARTEELRGTLDQTTGALTDQTNAWIADQLVKERSTGWLGDLMGKTYTYQAQAERLGITLEELASAWAGDEQAIARVRDRIEEVVAAYDALPDRASQRGSEQESLALAAQSLSRGLEGQVEALGKSQNATQDAARAQSVLADGVESTGRAYTRATNAFKDFSEEQAKAMDAAAQAARRTFDPNLGGRNLNLASEDDVARSRHQVEQATRRLRDAEQSRRDTLDKDKVTAAERVRAEESVADARKALQEATDTLAETEARTDPVAQYRKQVEEIIEASRTFVSDIQTLADQGLNAIDLAAIISAGPEGSADVRKALLGDPGMIDFTNEARETIEALGAELETQARVTNTAMSQAGTLLGGDLGLAMRIAAEEGSGETIQAIADKLEEDPKKIFDIGRRFGLSFLAGLSDAIDHQKTITFRPDGSFQTAPGALPGFHQGGIYPGYTPGRDIGFIGVSGGEAIMRPEWTRAVGADFVHRMNALARTGGVGAVGSEMRRYLGGFATGGIAPSPQVITVPVSSTNEHHTPMTFSGPIVTSDPADFVRQARQLRAKNNMIGG